MVVNQKSTAVSRRSTCSSRVHAVARVVAVARRSSQVDKGYYKDLIETWRKRHSNRKTGQFKTKENEHRYLDMKAMKDNIKADLIPFKTDQEILDEIVPSDNRQNMPGMGRKLPGGGLTSRRRANPAFGDVMTREQITQMFKQQEQEKELLRKQVEEAHNELMWRNKILRRIMPP
ncbi:hypothetical protein Tco_0665094 [Tanacetum coccineum]